ncbi:uncharacterized protein METZ01_LOCUS191193 [marine metagenome]|uniref:Uncharacterized protein n=1 Tax=marine metagenome TaxID=408172 RepID=A0A382DJI8_9ZZZZ
MNLFKKYPKVGYALVGYNHPWGFLFGGMMCRFGYD